MTQATAIPELKLRQPLGVLRLLRHLPTTIRLFGALLCDARVGAFPKALLVAALIYAVSPLDFLADWLPLIGVTDDLALLLLAGRCFVGLCPRPVVDEHLQRVAGR